MTNWIDIYGKARIACGDCLEIMPELTRGGVDMILCDLPYGTTKNTWDILIPLDQLWDLWLQVAKQNAAIVLFSQMPFTAQLINSAKKLFKYEWIWVKPQGTGFLQAKKAPLKAHENVLVFYRNAPTYNPQFWHSKPYTQRLTDKSSSNYRQLKIYRSESDGKRFPIDVVSFNFEHGLHPTQKPVDLCAYLIHTYTNPGEVVLDCCMGSGSTGIACIREDRNFIGIEKEPGYFDIARRRLEKEAAQDKLFSCE